MSAIVTIGALWLIFLLWLVHFQLLSNWAGFFWRAALFRVLVFFLLLFWLTELQWRRVFSGLNVAVLAGGCVLSLSPWLPLKCTYLPLKLLLSTVTVQFLHVQWQRALVSFALQRRWWEVAGIREMIGNLVTSSLGYVEPVALSSEHCAWSESIPQSRGILCILLKVLAEFSAVMLAEKSGIGIFRVRRAWVILISLGISIQIGFLGMAGRIHIEIVQKSWSAPVEKYKQKMVTKCYSLSCLLKRAFKNIASIICVVVNAFNNGFHNTFG